MMPQKKNPDSLEFLRGKTGRLFGNVRASIHLLAFTDCLLDVRILGDVEGSPLDLQQGPSRRQGAIVRHCRQFDCLPEDC